MNSISKSKAFSLLIDTFDDGVPFTRKRVLEALNQSGVEIKQATLNWRLYDWVDAGWLERVGRGVYRIPKKNKEVFYTIVSTSSLSKAESILKNELPFTDYCLWHTSVLSEFMRHQIAESVGIL